MRPMPDGVMRPGEALTGNEAQSKNRTQLARIDSVDVKKGSIAVRPGTSPSLENVEIPLTAGLAVNGFQTSYARSMPQQGDYVLLNYSPESTPYASAYATTANMSVGATARIDGYAEAQRAASENEQGFAGVMPLLAEGEHDCRSKGGARWYLDQFGQITFEAGLASLRLVKRRQEIIGEAGSFDLDANGSRLRLGQVKRLLTGAKPSSVGPTAKAWDLEVGIGTPDPAPNLRYYRERAGDVRLDIGGLPEPALTGGAPLRYDRTTYDVAGVVPTTVFQIDNVGNVSFTGIGPLGYTGTLVGPATFTSGAAISATAGLAMNLTAGAALNLAGGAVSVAGGTAVTIAAPQVFVGAPLVGRPFALAGPEFAALIEAIGAAIVLTADTEASGLLAGAAITAALQAYLATGITVIAKGT